MSYRVQLFEHGPEDGQEYTVNEDIVRAGVMVTARPSRMLLADWISADQIPAVDTALPQQIIWHWDGTKTASGMLRFRRRG